MNERMNDLQNESNLPSKRVEEGKTRLNAARNDAKSVADKDCPSFDEKRGKDRHDVFDVETIENRLKVDLFSPISHGQKRGGKWNKRRGKGEEEEKAIGK